MDVDGRFRIDRYKCRKRNAYKTSYKVNCAEKLNTNIYYKTNMREK